MQYSTRSVIYLVSYLTYIYIFDIHYLSFLSLITSKQWMEIQCFYQDIFLFTMLTYKALSSFEPLQETDSLREFKLHSLTDKDALPLPSAKLFSITRDTPFPATSSSLSPSSTTCIFLISDFLIGVGVRDINDTAVLDLWMTLARLPDLEYNPWLLSTKLCSVIRRLVEAAALLFVAYAPVLRTISRLIWALNMGLLYT